LFSGNFGNLGHDIAPSNIFSDTASSFQNQPGWAQGLELALPAILTAGATLGPELLGAGGAAAAEAGAGAFDLGTIGPGLAAGSDLSGLTASDVTFLDPTLLGEAAAPDAVPPAAAGDFASTFAGGANTAGFSQSGLPLTSGGLIDPSAAGMPSTLGDPSIYNYGATTGVDAATGAAPAAPTDLATIGPGAPAAPGPMNINPVTGAPAAAPGAPGGPGGAGPGILSTIGSTVKQAAPFIGLAGLGLTGYNAYEQKKQQDAIAQTEAAYQQSITNAANVATKAAQPLLTSGEALTQYLSTGTLPQGLTDLVSQQIASAKAARIQAAASMGQSTNPQFNTALAQDLAAIDREGVTLTTTLEQQLQQSGTQMVQTANQLISTGAQASEIAAQLPLAVQNLNLKLAQLTSTSIAAFAAALNGGSRQPGTITINTTTGAIGG
jgi:hypothetical protein